jgi:hypothetical protein
VIADIVDLDPLPAKVLLTPVERTLQFCFNPSARHWVSNVTSGAAALLSLPA